MNDRLLLSSAKIGDLQGVKTALDGGANLEAHDTTEHKATALALAVMHGHPKIVSFLISKGANIHYSHHYGASTSNHNAYNLVDYATLMFPSQNTQNILDDLLQAGLKLPHPLLYNIITGDLASIKSASTKALKKLFRCSAVQYAIANGQKEIVTFLREQRMTLFNQGELSEKEIFALFRSGSLSLVQWYFETNKLNTCPDDFLLNVSQHKHNLKVIKWLLTHKKGNIHTKTSEGFDVLMLAASSGCLDMVVFLCKEHPHLLKNKNRSNKNALILAAKNGYFDVFQYLMHFETQKENVGGALKKAVKREQVDIIDTILNKQNNMTDIQAFCLHLAIYYNKVSLVKHLHNHHHIDLNLTNKKSNDTPLIHACKNYTLEIIRYLLGSNVNIQAQNKAGKTAVYYALNSGIADIVEPFIHDFPMLTAHELENTPSIMEKSIRHDNISFISRLLDFKPDLLFATNHNGMSPALLAAKYRKADMLAAFIKHDEKVLKHKDNHGRDLVKTLITANQHDSCCLPILYVNQRSKQDCENFKKRAITIMFQANKLDCFHPKQLNDLPTLAQVTDTINKINHQLEENKHDVTHVIKPIKEALAQLKTDIQKINNVCERHYEEYFDCHRLLKAKLAFLLGEPIKALEHILQMNRQENPCLTTHLNTAEALHLDPITHNNNQQPPLHESTQKLFKKLDLEALYDKLHFRNEPIHKLNTEMLISKIEDFVTPLIQEPLATNIIVPKFDWLKYKSIKHLTWTWTITTTNILFSDLFDDFDLKAKLENLRNQKQLEKSEVDTYLSFLLNLKRKASNIEKETFEDLKNPLNNLLKKVSQQITDILTCIHDKKNQNDTIPQHAKLAKNLHEEFSALSLYGDFADHSSTQSPPNTTNGLFFSSQQQPEPEQERLSTHHHDALKATKP